MLPVCYCLTKDDIVVYGSSVTETLMHIVSSHGSFQIPSSRKLSTDDIFFIRATRAANELNAADIITFDISLLTLNYSLFEYLKARPFKFCNLNKSCSHFVKSVCSFCFAQVKHMSFLQSNPYKIKLFFSRSLSLQLSMLQSPANFNDEQQ